MAMSRMSLGVAAFVILLVGFAFGFLLSYTGIHYSSSEKAGKLDSLTKESNEEWSKTLLETADSNKIRQYHKEITKVPHLAGTPGSAKVAHDLVKFWKDLGFKSHTSRYNVLLSYPDKENPNKIELQDGSGQAVYTTQLFEKILRPEQNQSEVVPPFNAYAAAGTPKGDLIYVNYGRLEDFSWLKEEKNQDFSGKICIARYGKIFRGDKAKFAERFGAAGLIIYSDPADYATGDHEVYPKTWWLPPTGVQRGSIFIAGDPLTPGYPSIDSAYRIDEDDVGFPGIPVHPIGYGDAQALLQGMSGDTVPNEWQGALNFTYRIGPGFVDNDRKVQMFIHNSKQNASVYNAFAVIKGAVEPDRYVLLGNHHDAWVFGAVDPSSGTSVLKELSRVFAEMIKSGWQPRRTIVLCAWAAEEFSLIGSREFVEEHRHMLSSRAVAYLNVDSAVTGNGYMRGKTLPMLIKLVLDVAKTVPNPDPSEVEKGRRTIYDTWTSKSPEKDRSGRNTGKPKVSILGSGSDFEAFVIQTGVTSIDARYCYDERIGISSHPLYHSVYETHHLMDNIMDLGFRYHKAVVQYWGELTRRLADDYILPFRVQDYSASLQQYTNSILDRYGDLMRQEGLGRAIDYLVDALRKLRSSANKFDERLQNIDKTNPIEVRMYNDQMIQLERVFIDPQGLPGRKYTRHVVFAPSTQDTYSGSSFPALVDSLFHIDKLLGQEKSDRWEEVKKQLSVVTYFIHAATKFLNDFDAL